MKVILFADTNEILPLDIKSCMLSLVMMLLLACLKVIGRKDMSKKQSVLLF